MRKNKTNNYAENLTCHGTKLSHSKCIPADPLAPSSSATSGAHISGFPTKVSVLHHWAGQRLP